MCVCLQFLQVAREDSPRADKDLDSGYYRRNIISHALYNNAFLHEFCIKIMTVTLLRINYYQLLEEKDTK